MPIRSDLRSRHVRRNTQPTATLSDSAVADRADHFDALDEAREDLTEPNIDSRPSMLCLVDMCLDYAESHLQRVDKALSIHGPDAVFAN